MCICHWCEIRCSIVQTGGTQINRLVFSLNSGYRQRWMLLRQCCCFKPRFKFCLKVGKASGYRAHELEAFSFLLLVPVDIVIFCVVLVAVHFCRAIGGTGDVLRPLGDQHRLRNIWNKDGSLAAWQNKHLQRFTFQFYLYPKAKMHSRQWRRWSFWLKIPPTKPSNLKTANINMSQIGVKPLPVSAQQLRPREKLDQSLWCLMLACSISVSSVWDSIQVCLSWDWQVFVKKTNELQRCAEWLHRSTLHCLSGWCRKLWARLF